MNISRIIISLCLACILVLSFATKAIACCGFCVDGADAKLVDPSQVIIACNGDRPILTMANDFQGAVKDVAKVGYLSSPAC